MPNLHIRPIAPAEIAQAKRLILSVARGIFQWPETPAETFRRFDENGELQDVDEALTHYAPPAGIFLVAVAEGQLIGTGAVRPLTPFVCELKRLWLLETYQGQGIGFQLMQALFAFARGAGYTTMRLMTETRQTRAISFYQRLGFQPIAPYHDDTDEEDVFMEFRL